MNEKRGEKTPAELRAILKSGIDQIGITANTSQLESLLFYLDLLEKWNHAYNLSGIKDKTQMLVRHVLDSLAISPFIDGKVIVDVGSGAGLPGIPLAIIHPHRQFILIDSNGKKTRFLFHVKSVLGLTNISIENKRIEDYQCPEQIDIVLSRAFSTLANMLQFCASVIGDNCRVLAMKGVVPTAEIEGLTGIFRVTRVINLHVPGLDEDRHLIEIKQHGLPPLD